MSKSKARTPLVAALDIGTSKVCCFIGRRDGDGPRVVGAGHQIAHGLRGGAVVDMMVAERSVLAAVHAAEQMAGETIREVYVNFSAGNPASHRVGVEVALNGHEIGDSDLRRVLLQGRNCHVPGAREIVHSIPVSYTIDGNRGIRDPRGMFGEKLGVSIHVVTAESAPLRNLTHCVSRCHLDIVECIVSPYAAGVASLVEDEMELGVTLVEIGAGTTGVAIFFEGDVVHADVLPIGGNHITNDIARGMSTPVRHAERMKALFGNAIASPADNREMIDVRQVGEGEDAGTNPVPRAHLNDIIRPRVEEILELVRGRIEASGFDRIAGRRLVLTGGGSQLPGLRELAAQVLDKQVRIGRPQGLTGLPDAMTGPAFASCAGLMLYAARRQAETLPYGIGAHLEVAGPIGRIGQWFREYL